MTRRPDGALEGDVLRALWDLDRPASPSEVIEEMNTELALSCIATILCRLCDKGLASRRRMGRAFVYEAVSSEAELTTDRIRSLLDSTEDRQLALTGFVKALDPADMAMLNALLNEKS